MSLSTYEAILRKQELRNEKRVSYIRGLLASAGILEVLAYLGLINFLSRPTSTALMISSGLFLYALIIIILLHTRGYQRHLKYFVIVLDYLYVGLSFIFDPSLVENPDVIKWFALVGVVMFFLINLLRYSRTGTLFAAFLAQTVFLIVCLYFRTPVQDIVSLNIALVIILAIGYSVTASSKSMMRESSTKSMMERYLPPQLINEIYEKKNRLEPGGDQKRVTILFSDIRDFTTITESMRVDDVVSFLNDYLSAMTEIIFQQGGTIDKFMGDAIMTIFGAPVQADDDALRAVQTALAMKRALPVFNKQHPELKEPLRIGIGIHTGEVIAGNIGSDRRLDYTVIGDSVNIASRIEGLTPYYRCPLLISETTLREISEAGAFCDFLTREVDIVKVKGKEEAIRIYEVMDFRKPEEKAGKEILWHQFAEGLALYRQRDFKRAELIFHALEPDELSALYVGRCRDFSENPPPEEWQGVHLMDRK